MAKTLYIIDGHAQIYRAYYAPFRDLTSPTGEPTRATYVFCTMLLKFLKTQVTDGDCVAMAVDGPIKDLKRKDIFSDYKVTRKPAPDDFYPQATRIIEIVRTMGIPVLEAKGYEADDIMATAAQRFANDDLKVVLISRDKDLDQLVCTNVVLYDPMKDETYDAAAILDKKGYSPDKAIEIQTLMGDSTDNIPGVPGVGPKTALKLIDKYGTADEVLAHAEEQTPKLAANLKTAVETIDISRKLVTLDKNVPMELDLDAMAFSGIDGPAIAPMFKMLGFDRLLDQLGDTGDGNAPVETEKENTAAADFDYRLIDTPKLLDSLIDKLQNVKRIAVDTETTSIRAMKATLVGISLAWEPGKAFYLPVRGPLGAVVLDSELVIEKLGPILADPTIEKIGQNIKYDIIILNNAGYTVAGKLFDTMVAAHVLDSTRMTYKMDALAAEFINHHCIPITDVIGRGKSQVTIDTVPTDMVAVYAAEDADVTLRLADVLVEKLAEQPGLADLLADLEMPLLPVLVEMEENGITLDPQSLKRMEIDLSKQVDLLHDKIIESAGRQFNPDSPKQLAVVLFEDLELPIIKKVKTGPSTDSGVLEELAAQHELPRLVLDYRKLTKLLGTYVKSLAASINPRTGRVHTSFHQAGTATGRLSSSDPNLQNIPIRTAEGRKIRQAFIAPPGTKLIAADYSQIELRMLAHLCGDPKLCEAFASDQDIHKIVAAEVFGVPVSEVTSEQRGRAKTVNFGIIYGQTAHGLSRTLGISRGEAGDYIKNYRKRFPEIDKFLKSCIEHAKEHGYVETIFARRRNITEIDSRNPQRRAFAERLALNSVVQGSAADLIKRAMINIDNRLKTDPRPSRMLLQIHDELVLETPEDAVESDRQMIVEEMCGAVELTVPLKVDIASGDNWMEAK
ncbi:MAG: DNA polymerase I [Phycisphaerales bacterium]|jgi:DNA polymerase I|nr:DNA polymerase I [Phycisphaerales bacterium]